MNIAFTSLYTHSKARSKHFGTINTGESMTQQDDAHDADINIIMKSYSPGALLPQITKTPLYGDFTTTNDYRTMVETVRAADAAFAEVPAAVRSRFNNDPSEFIKFANNKDNLEELRKMGLAPQAPEPPKPPEPMAVRIVPEEPAKPAK